MKLLPVIALFLVTVSLGAKDVDINAYSTRISRFVDDTAFMVDAGDKERFTKRLPATFSVAIESDDAALKAAVLTQLETFSKAANITSTVSTETKDALLAIYIGPKKELSKIADTYSKLINLNTGKNYWVWWDEDRTINRAVIFLCVDVIKQPEKQLAALPPLLMGVFGIPSTSTEFPDSCLYPNNTFATLQPIDSRLLQFYYRSVPAGTRPPELRKLVKEAWEKQ